MTTKTRTPEPCTSVTARKRHLSPNLDSYGVPGRQGFALCGVGVLDQDALNHRYASWGETAPTITDMPACRSCATKGTR